MGGKLNAYGADVKAALGGSKAITADVLKKARQEQLAQEQQNLRDEEQHIDFLETQLDLIGRIGVQNWIKLNSGDAGSG